MRRRDRWNCSNTQPSITIHEVGKDEHSRRLSVEIDVPGMKKEDLTVSVVEDEKVLIVKGVTKGDETIGRLERKVDARISLPRMVNLKDNESVKASMEDGVLRVEAVKSSVEGRRVPIN
jgi:HSP20 family molecular chaperone IbpA